MKEKFKLFPINYMRDVALKNCRSEIVMFIEDDYAVPKDFRENMLKRA